MAKEWLKKIIPNSIREVIIYLRHLVLRYLIKKYFRSYYLYEDSVLREIDPSKKISFFGYYGLTPDNNQKVLYLSVDRENKHGSQYEEASIFLSDKKRSYVKLLGKTSSWNWQQGAMLQWIDSAEKRNIIFNDYDSSTEQYVSKIIDQNGALIRKFEQPVYCLHPESHIALSLNFDRLRVLRPDYGYFNKPEFTLPDNENDGIWLINLESKESKRIIDLKKLCDLQYSQSMVEATHKVNHIIFNPIGNRFMFLHRWIGPKGRYTRLMTSDLNGDNLKILNGDKMTSHCCWLNEKSILAYCTVESKGTGYFEIDDNTGNRELFSDKMPKEDGHPSISPDSKWIVTDTYPDLSRFSKLYLFNINSNNLYPVGKFYQPLRYRKEMRIDLHPKWSEDGKAIYIESGHIGNRKMFEIDVSNIIDKK